MFEQLYKKENNEYIKIFPLNYIQNLIDSESGNTLASILTMFNNIALPYQNNAEDTRNLIPVLLRRKGLWITYNNGEEFITEYFCGTSEDIADNWHIDANWERVPNLKYVQENADKIPDGSITSDKLSPALQELIKQNNTIINLADDEDLEEVNSALKFKDKKYNANNASGLGRKILRKNWKRIGSKLINVLTQEMINESNTIYIIQYDYDLIEKEIKIPENCVLQFEGGSFSNGSIVFNNTLLKGVIKINCSFEGNIFNKEIYTSWFYNTSYSNYNILNHLLNQEYKVIIVDSEIHVNDTINDDYVYLINKPNILKGVGNGKIIIDYIKPNCNLFKLYPIINSEGYGFYDMIIENPNVNGNHIIYIELLEIGQVLRKFYIYNCMFPISNGYNIYMYHPETLDGYFTSSIEKCTFKGGVYLDRLGDSVTIANCVFTQKHGVYIKNVPASNQCVFKENNVTCDEGLHFYKCLNLRVLNNNIECSNEDVSLLNNTYVNILGESESNPLQGTVIEGNTLVYGARTTIDTTINMLYVANLLAPVISHNLFTQRENAKGLIIDSTVKFCNVDNNFISGLPWSGEKIIKDNGYKTFYNNRILTLSGENYLGNEYDIIAEKYKSRKILDYNGTSIFERYNSKITENICISRNIDDTIKKQYYLRHINSDGFYENDTIEILFITDKGFEFPSARGLQIKNSRGGTSTISFSKDTSIIKKEFEKGDIIFNLDSNYNNDIGWMCIEPGKWKSLNNLIRTTYDSRPLLTDAEIGKPYFDETLNTTIIWDGEKWVNNNGYKAELIKGTTQQRPVLESTDEGFEYYDSTLKKKILWNGSEWTNLDGTSLE